MRASVVAALWGLLAASCTNGVQGDDATLVMGTLTSVDSARYPVPPSGRVEIVWSVSSGNPDYAYIFGEGRSDGDVFEVPLDGDPPPAQAFNDGEFGIGFLLLFDNSTDLPNGLLPDLEEADAAIVGAAMEYVIIYRVPGASQTFRPWVERFEDGYSCGKLIRVDDGFDEFEPIDCQDIEIMVGPLSELDGPNWT